ncbi:hypothetical protein HYE82_16995 [Streptomyces sp. BR123]|jgi:hypothetical protein|uniref:hypothetical protein n=1 Tax=Streptomyces sp. BR123 TaxID=2749828 RepID=UPI0015C46DD4|nr:hypothetical protein [Streptomyces sp. BR123]NXY96053.1 hypothetical protein [Streptomyces sp. BR123]
MEAGPRDTGRDGTRGTTDPAVLGDSADPALPDELGLPADPARLTSDGPDAAGSGEDEEPGGPEFEVELRPQRRLRIWQIAPIVMLAAAGSLMFAFPLAFEFGDGGAVVAMLGFLISCCAAGWGMMAARRVGYTWPGLPPRGSGRRPDWRMAALYALVVLAVVGLAVYRVARLR